MSATTAASFDEFEGVQADWASGYVQCINDAGGNARVLDSGSIEMSPIPGREQRSDGMDASCLDEVGPPPVAPPLNDEFLSGMYVLFLEQGDCLRAEGYVIPDAPNRQTWVENYGAESWDPLSAVYDVGEDVGEAMRLCPQPDPVEAERRGRDLQDR